MGARRTPQAQGLLEESLDPPGEVARDRQLADSLPQARRPVSQSTDVMTIPGGGVNEEGGDRRRPFCITSAQIGSAMSAPVRPIGRASSAPTHTPTTRSGV